MENAQKYYICEVSIIFENAKKVLNFIQNLINAKKVIKSLAAFHKTPFPTLMKKTGSPMPKQSDDSCLQENQEH